MSKEVKKEEAIAEGHFRISNLWKEEDWLAIWIGFIVIAIGSISVLTGAFDFSALKFSTWGNGKSLLEQFTPSFGAKLLLTAFVLGTLFTIGNVLRGKKVKEYLPAFRTGGSGSSDQRGVHTEPLPGMGVFRTGDWIADRKYRRSSQLAEAGGTDRVLYQGRSGNHGIFRTVFQYC